MIYDKEFLVQLDNYKHKVVYARITALTFNETPIEYIEGRVTQGSIQMDGASSMRRTCSLTIVATDFNYQNYYWGLNTKFKLEIGLENHINSSYPDIIWFNQGIYLITSFNTAESTSSFTISIQGKDKMCLLNGEIGGVLESEVNFGVLEEESFNGVWTTTKVPIYDIIKNIVHIYGGEPLYNIIIKDLDTYGLELLEYQYDTPLFLYRRVGSNIYTNAFLKGDSVTCSVYDEDGLVSGLNDVLLCNVPSEYFDSLTTTLVRSDDQYIFKIGKENYHMAKIDYGQTAGYRQMELVFNEDLIAGVGDSLTSVLDKIRDMLTEFEYFYNLDGQFVFQKKQYVKEAIWQFNDDRVFQNISTSLSESSEKAYYFYDNNLITAFNNTPNLSNIKNDYSIWGERDGISGIKIPVHLRYAIDKKPLQYTRIKVDYGSDSNPGADYEAIRNYNTKYKTNIQGQTSIVFSSQQWDWREIIYQMALDYYKYNFLDDFELKVAAANPIDYPTGRTGYEQYYTDLQGFWRQLYYPDFENRSLFDEKGNSVEYKTISKQIQDLRIELYGTPPKEGYENYIGGISADLSALAEAKPEDQLELIKDFSYSFEGYDEDDLKENPKLYLALLQQYFFKQKDTLSVKEYELERIQKKYENVCIDDFYLSGDITKKYWNKKIYKNPDQLNFWFDFLDTGGELQQYSVKAIGDRPKSINDTNIKSIYFRETPSVIYLAPEDDQSQAQEGNTGFRFLQAPDFDYMFKRSPQGKSAKESLDELFLQHSYCVENVTITSIPIYYLEPNTRIYLYNKDTGIEGDYIINSISLPLTYNGTMSITATKAAENIL